MNVPLQLRHQHTNAHVYSHTTLTMCCWIDRNAEREGWAPDSIGGVVGAFRETLHGLLPLCFPLMVISSTWGSQVSLLVCLMLFLIIRRQKVTLRCRLSSFISLSFHNNDMVGEHFPLHNGRTLCMSFLWFSRQTIYPIDFTLWYIAKDRR